MPAKAGIQSTRYQISWIPVFAGMTVYIAINSMAAQLKYLDQNGVLGDPRPATAEAGKKYLADIIEFLFCLACFARMGNKDFGMISKTIPNLFLMILGSSITNFLLEILLEMIANCSLIVHFKYCVSHETGTPLG